VYRVADYLWMLADPARVDAYAGAIRALVKPGDRVLEIGAGIGFFSVLAVRAGAAHVDAVEPNPAIHLGPRLAQANGCDGRITFHHCHALDLALATPADVLIADLRGPLPFCGRALETLADVRQRLMRPSAAIIARRDVLYAAPVRAPQAFRREVEMPLRRRDICLEPVARVLYDTPLRYSMPAGDLVLEGKPWLTIDYRSVVCCDGGGEASWDIEQRSAPDGIAVWFVSDVAEGFEFSTAPGHALSPYGQLFLPFRHPVLLEAGDSLRIGISVHLAGDDYVWAWRLWRNRGRQGDELVVDQNSLAELVIDPSALPATADATVASPRPAGRALRLVLESIEDGQPIGAIASRLVERFPDLFATRDRALAFVTKRVAELGI